MAVAVALPLMLVMDKEQKYAFGLWVVAVDGVLAFSWLMHVAGCGYLWWLCW